MPPQVLATRVERLEQRMTSLEKMPARIDRVEAQVVQLREEIRAEFFAIRGGERTPDTASLLSLSQEITAVRLEIVALRGEMHVWRDEMGALRREMDALRGEIDSLRREMDTPRGEVAALRDEMGALRVEVHALRDEMDAIRGGERTTDMPSLLSLRDEIRRGDEQTRHLMRVLHEDVIARLATIQEGQHRDAPRSTGRKGRR